MEINPWSSAQYADYSRLREQFGIQALQPDDWEQLPRPPSFFRRGIVFGHRGFGLIRQAILAGDPWALLTGLMPSGRMHLGHKMVIDQIIYYQSIGADVFIAIADIEAYATRGYTLEEAERLAIQEYVTNYIALGLQPCTIYFQSRHRDVKNLGYLLGKKANWSEVTAIYGFNGATNMAHVLAPLIQCGDILHVQMEKYGGARPTLVPVGVDQDPHIRFCRGVAAAHRLFNVTVAKDGRIGVFVKPDEDVARLLDLAAQVISGRGLTMKRLDRYKAVYLPDASPEDIPALDLALAREEQEHGAYGFLSPSSTYHRFMTGLTGGKMSSSKPESAIFLTDTPAEAKKKIMAAKTGGAVSREEHKKHGGQPESCVVYEMFLYHLIDSDRELADIYRRCRSGEQMCGDCKKMAVCLMESFLVEMQEKRAAAAEQVGDYVVWDEG
ncbi:MAG: tryptophan--tRNA ligase [Candidatus Thermoplasmatota archaeon]|nr:tryptophan--tRNA ligase [Candidatus Thermoplasmatota archaeon]